VAFATDRGSSNHAAEHPFAAGQNQADHHHGQQEEDQAEERGDEATSLAELLLLLHFQAQLLGPRQVERKVRFGS